MPSPLESSFGSFKKVNELRDFNNNNEEKHQEHDTLFVSSQHKYQPTKLNSESICFTRSQTSENCKGTTKTITPADQDWNTDFLQCTSIIVDGSIELSLKNFVSSESQEKTIDFSQKEVCCFPNEAVLSLIDTTPSEVGKLSSITLVQGVVLSCSVETGTLIAPIECLAGQDENKIKVTTIATLVVKPSAASPSEPHSLVAFMKRLDTSSPKIQLQVLDNSIQTTATLVVTSKNTFTFYNNLIEKVSDTAALIFESKASECNRFEFSSKITDLEQKPTKISVVLNKDVKLAITTLDGKTLDTQKELLEVTLLDYAGQKTIIVDVPHSYIDEATPFISSSPGTYTFSYAKPTLYHICFSASRPAADACTNLDKTITPDDSQDWNTDFLLSTSITVAGPCDFNIKNFVGTESLVNTIDFSKKTIHLVPENSVLSLTDTTPSALSTTLSSITLVQGIVLSCSVETGTLTAPIECLSGVASSSNSKTITATIMATLTVSPYTSSDGSNDLKAYTQCFSSDSKITIQVDDTITSAATLVLSAQNEFTFYRNDFARASDEIDMTFKSIKCSEFDFFSKLTEKPADPTANHLHAIVNGQALLKIKELGTKSTSQAGLIEVTLFEHEQTSPGIADQVEVEVPSNFHNAADPFKSANTESYVFKYAPKIYPSAICLSSSVENDCTDKGLYVNPSKDWSQYYKEANTVNVLGTCTTDLNNVIVSSSNSVDLSATSGKSFVITADGDSITFEKYTPPSSPQPPIALTSITLIANTFLSCSVETGTLTAPIESLHYSPPSSHIAVVDSYLFLLPLHYPGDPESPLDVTPWLINLNTETLTLMARSQTFQIDYLEDKKLLLSNNLIDLSKISVSPTIEIPKDTVLSFTANAKTSLYSASLVVKASVEGHFSILSSLDSSIVRKTLLSFDFGPKGTVQPIPTVRVHVPSDFIDGSTPFTTIAQKQEVTFVYDKSDLCVYSTEENKCDQKWTAVSYNDKNLIQMVQAAIVVHIVENGAIPYTAFSNDKQSIYLDENKFKIKPGVILRILIEDDSLKSTLLATIPIHFQQIFINAQSTSLEIDSNLDLTVERLSCYGNPLGSVSMKVENSIILLVDPTVGETFDYIGTDGKKNVKLSDSTQLTYLVKEKDVSVDFYPATDTVKFGHCTVSWPNEQSATITNDPVTSTIQSLTMNYFPDGESTGLENKMDFKIANTATVEILDGFKDQKQQTIYLDVANGDENTQIPVKYPPGFTPDNIDTSNSVQIVPFKNKDATPTPTPILPMWAIIVIAVGSVVVIAIIIVVSLSCAGVIHCGRSRRIPKKELYKDDDSDEEMVYI